MTMEFAYEPPKAFEHLAPKKAARTQLGWGVGDDGSIDLEHVMSSNPFAGKTQNWGIAMIDQNGDIVIQSKGPGNAESEVPLPPELIQKIVQFYESEGLNVRNIAEKTALDYGPDVPEGMCPVCHSSEVYGVPGTPYVDCESCGWHGEDYEVLDAHSESPLDDDSNYQQEFISDASTKTAGVSLQGATIHGQQPVQGLVIRPDQQSEEDVKTLLAQLPGADEQLRQYVDERNRGDQTSFPPYDNPYVNRGGSFLSEKIEDHFIEEQPNPKVADTPIGMPGTGPGDTRNFNEGASTIVVAKNLITDHAWAYLGDIGRHCKGLVTELGGSGSHAALVAGGANLPLITGVPVDSIKPGDNARLDPATGTVDVNGGSNDVQQGDTTVKEEAARFVWSNGSHMGTPFGEPDADTHINMIMTMATNGQLELDPETYEPVNATRGVIYSNGAGEYYDQISDADAMTAWAHQTYPQLKSMEYKPTGANYMVARVAEITESAPKCPECDSHTYKPMSLPSKSEGSGDALLKCLNCGTEYKHEVYRNPKKSIDMATLSIGISSLTIALNAANIAFIRNMGQKRKAQDEVFRILREYDVPYEVSMDIYNKLEAGENPKKILSDLQAQYQISPQGSVQEPTEEELASDDPPEWFVEKLQTDLEESLKEGMQKGAPYPENSDKNAPDHSPPHQDWPKKVNSIYNACMREGNGRGDSKEEKESSCAAIAWAQYKKMKKSSEEKTANILIEDTNGEPLQTGKLYLMHSIKYRVPDVVQLIKADEHSIEAHIESDVAGAFPIKIDSKEFDAQSYSFEPYAAAVDPQTEDLFNEVVAVLHGQRGNPEAEQVAQELLNEFGPTENVLQAIPDADALSNFMLYPRTHRNTKLKTARVSRIVVDGIRQRELINENPGGRARNFEKLDLKGTHYEQKDYELVSRDDLSEYFLF
jgi:phosphohistidine swiveling domain-containing protein